MATPKPDRTNPSAANGLCDCERPVPRQHAERKGVATTVCARCGLPLPVEWR
jgi:hypothetical protein